MLSGQFAGLTTNQINALTTSQVGELSMLDIQSLSTNQIYAFSSNQIAVLTTSTLQSFAQISPLVLDLTGVEALSTANIAGLATSAFEVLTSTSGPGVIQTQQIGQSGVIFDLGNTGATNANVGWITPGEGFLVDLPSGATTITNGSELFGTATMLPNGQQAPNGFAALSIFDQNKSGSIDSSDPIFNQLQVWVDTGINAGTPTGSLFTLDELNIQSLNLNAKVADITNNANTIGLISSYTTKDGQTHELADVWLASTAGTGDSINLLTNALNQYSSSGSVAVGLNSGVINQESSSVGGSSNNNINITASNANYPNATLTNTTNIATTNSAALLANALSQYNANGQLISNTANTPSAGVLTGANISANQLLGSANEQASTSSPTPTNPKSS